MLGVEGLIGLAGQTRTRAAHFESTAAYADGQTERTFTSVGPSGTVADHPATRTREGAWSVLWDIWISPGATGRSQRSATRSSVGCGSGRQPGRRLS